MSAILLPCGNTARLDPGSSIGAYRCDLCWTVVGSIAMPKECAALLKSQGAQEVHADRRPA